MRLRSKTYSLSYKELGRALGIKGQVIRVEEGNNNELLLTHSYDEDLHNQSTDEFFKECQEMLSEADQLLRDTEFECDLKDDWEVGIEFIPEEEDERE